MTESNNKIETQAIVDIANATDRILVYMERITELLEEKERGRVADNEHQG